MLRWLEAGQPQPGDRSFTEITTTAANELAWISVSNAAPCLQFPHP